MSEEKEKTKLDERWKKFLKKHWKLGLLVVAGLIVAAIGAVLVFLVFKDYAQGTGGLVPLTLGAWTLGYMVTFGLNLLLWEFLFIGIPVIIAAVVIMAIWWKRLPEEEKEEYKRDPKKGRRGKTTGSGGGISFLYYIIWLIIVFAQGNWDLAFSSWTLNYLIDSSLLAMGLILLIGGIPITIGLIWWLRRELKETP